VGGGFMQFTTREKKRRRNEMEIEREIIRRRAVSTVSKYIKSFFKNMSVKKETKRGILNMKYG
jgi:hypothetical protein